MQCFTLASLPTFFLTFRANITRTLLGAKGIATRSKGLTSSNKKLLETRIRLFSHSTNKSVTHEPKDEKLQNQNADSNDFGSSSFNSAQLVLFLAFCNFSPLLS